MKQILKDALNRIIAKVEVKSNGDKVLKDPLNRILGYYDARQNVTKDEMHRIVAKGDCLTALIRRI